MIFHWTNIYTKINRDPPLYMKVRYKEIGNTRKYKSLFSNQAPTLVGSAATELWTTLYIMGICIWTNAIDIIGFLV